MKKYIHWDPGVKRQKDYQHKCTIWVWRYWARHSYVCENLQLLHYSANKILWKAHLAIRSKPSNWDFEVKIASKLDQGALGMSDPLGPLQLALKPNSASSINRPLLNFYYCAHWSLIMGNTEAWKQLNWYSTNSDLTVPAEVICQDGGGYMPIANWYSTNSDLTVPAKVICQQQYSGGYMPIDTLRTQT